MEDPEVLRFRLEANRPDRRDPFEVTLPVGLGLRAWADDDATREDRRDPVEVTLRASALLLSAILRET